MPKVSVMILTKDRPLLLRKALESVLKQKFKDFEIVIGDNHSVTDIKPMLAEFMSQGLAIKHLYHDPEVSITENRQRVLSACLGEYIAPLDDDDSWCHPDKLNIQVKFLDSHPKVVMVGGAIRKVNDAGGSLGIKFRPQSDGAIRRSMFFRNNFFTSTLMFRKKAAEQAGGFMFIDNDYSEDYYLWLRLGLVGEMRNLNEIFTDYRLPNYPPAKRRGFFLKQLTLVEKLAGKYPCAFLAKWYIKLRLALMF